MIQRLADMPPGTLGFREAREFALDDLAAAKAWVAGEGLPAEA